MASNIVLDINSPQSAYEEVINAAQGTIFKVVEQDYETVLGRLAEYTPTNRNLKVASITPGTSMYATVGANHLVIVENSLITE